MDLRAAHPQAEPIQLVHYSVGQKYDAHYDWSVREPSTRFATLLLYLNEPQVLWQSSRGAREALRGVARRCEALRGVARHGCLLYINDPHVV